MANKIPDTYDGLKAYHERMVSEATAQINDLRKKVSTAEEAQKKAEEETKKLKAAAVDPKVVEAAKVKIAEAEKVKAEAEKKAKAAEQRASEAEVKAERLQKELDELKAKPVTPASSKTSWAWLDQLAYTEEQEAKGLRRQMANAAKRLNELRAEAELAESISWG